MCLLFASCFIYILFKFPILTQVDIIISIFYFMILIFSIIIDLQCSVISTVQQSDPVIYIFFFLTLSSIMFYPKKLDIVPCAIQQDLIAYPLQRQKFASCKPKLPVPPSPSPSLLGNHKSILQVHEFASFL